MNTLNFYFKFYINIRFCIISFKFDMDKRKLFEHYHALIQYIISIFHTVFFYQY